MSPVALVVSLIFTLHAENEAVLVAINANLAVFVVQENRPLPGKPSGLSDGRRLPRDVEFLCAIAWGDGGITDEMPYPPRGSFPEDASYYAKNSFFVSEDEVREYLEVSRLEDEDEISLEEYARRRVIGL
jgi:hypothetical protein